MQILLVEDDEQLASGLIKALSHHQFTVNHLGLGLAALTQIQAEPPDIVILDLGLPDIDGLELLKKLRNKAHRLPVLLLTARDSISDKVAGLNLGADDYLTKPFEMDELVARLHVIERRIGTAKESQISAGKVTLNSDSHQVSVDQHPTELSRREYMLLKALMERTGHILSKEQLAKTLYNWDEETGSNTIEVHIHNLRKKLPEGFIKTVRGIGYTINLS